MPHTRTGAAVLAVLLGTAVAHAELIAADHEFQVNEFTTLSQYDPRVAVLPGGGFVVAWQNSSNRDPRARIFDSTGVAAGAEFVVNEFTPGLQYHPALAADASGTFTVAWVGTPNAGGVDAVYARRFDSSGSALGSQFQVNTATDAAMFFVEVGAAPSGEVVMVYGPTGSSGGPIDGSGAGVLAQRYDSTGAVLGTEFVVNSYTTDDQNAGRVAVAADGSFAVVWVDERSGLLEDDVYAQIFDSAAVPVGTEYQVNTFTTGAQIAPDIAVDGSGYVIVWQSIDQVDEIDVIGRRFDSAGSALGPEFVVNTYTSGEQGGARVEADPLGGFVVAFSSAPPFTPVPPFNVEEAQAPFVRRYDAAGNPTGTEYILGEAVLGLQADVDVAVTAGGSLMAVWQDLDFSSAPGADKDGSDSGVFAMRHCRMGDVTCDRCAGFDDTIDADADGIPDGCDACTNVGGSRDFVGKSKYRASSNFDSTFPTKTNQLRLRGEVALAPGDFATIDPIATGVRQLVLTGQGGTISDIDVPAGAYAGKGTTGWQSKSNGKKWLFKDDTGAADGGIGKIVLRDASSKSPGLVKFVTRAKGDRYPSHDFWVAPRAVLTLGDAVAADAGICGESTFIAADCKSDEESIRCKR